MKARVFSFVFALIALFNYSVAEAQSVKISNPDRATVDLTAYPIDGGYRICIDYVRLTGLGNATSATASLTVVATGDVTCLSPGQQKRDPEVANPSPGQSIGATGDTQTLTPSNGNLVIEDCVVYVDLIGSCKNANQEVSGLSNINVSNIYLTINGKQVSLNDWKSQLVFN